MAIHLSNCVVIFKKMSAPSRQHAFHQLLKQVTPLSNIGAAAAVIEHVDQMRLKPLENQHCYKL